MKNKKLPETAYECWMMNCKDCIFYDKNKDTCNHPECYQSNGELEQSRG